jgi:hypothetical protein
MMTGFLPKERKKREASPIYGLFTTPDYSQIEPNEEITESIRAYLHRLA